MAKLLSVSDIADQAKHQKEEVLTFLTAYESGALSSMSLLAENKVIQHQRESGFWYASLPSTKFAVSSKPFLLYLWIARIPAYSISPVFWTKI